MCGACGRTVVGDPVLGPLRTMRQHLLVAQTVNSACRAWPGAPKVAATRDGWLVSGPTGATVAAHTVQDVWSAVLRGTRGGRPPELPGAPRSPRSADAAETPSDRAAPDTEEADLSRRVLDLGQRMARDRVMIAAADTGT